MDATLSVDVNWSVFEPTEVELVKRLIESGQVENIAAAIQRFTPEIISEIEKIQAALRPRDFVFTSDLQQEFDQWMNQAGNRITPEELAEWQVRLDEEKAQKLAQLTGNGLVKATVANSDGTQQTIGSVSNNIRDLDISEKSIQKLVDAGIHTVEDFQKLEWADKIKLVGPVVASKFKTLNAS